MDKSTPTIVMDRLIQYDYRNLYKNYTLVAKLKTEARFTNDIKNRDLRARVRFNYRRINTDQIPLTWAQIWNKIYSRGKKCKVTDHSHLINYITGREHILETLEEYNFYNVLQELYSYINLIKPTNLDTSRLYMLHKLLLSIV